MQEDKSSSFGSDNDNAWNDNKNINLDISGIHISNHVPNNS